LKSPCRGCISVCLCRHKEFGYLIRECSLLSEVLYVNGVHGVCSNMYNDCLKDTEKVLEPLKWRSVERDGPFNVKIAVVDYLWGQDE